MKQIEIPIIGQKGYIKRNGKIRECVITAGFVKFRQKPQVQLMVRMADKNAIPNVSVINSDQCHIYATPEDCRFGHNPLPTTKQTSVVSVVDKLFKGQKYTWSTDIGWRVLRYRWNGQRPAVKSFPLPSEILFDRKGVRPVDKFPDFGKYIYPTAKSCIDMNREVVTFANVQRATGIVISFT